MPATTDVRPETTGLEESFLPALLRSPEPTRPLLSPPKTAPARPHPDIARIAAVVLIVPCAYFGLRLAGVEGLPSLPGALPAEDTSVVAANPADRTGRDARELRSLRAASASAAVHAGRPRASRRDDRDKPSGGHEQPPSGGGSGGGGDGGGGGTDGTKPNLTLPVIGETPIPDPGVEVPDLPVDPGVVPDTDDVVQSAGVTVPDVDVPLP
jgi:hypothetical protein